MAQTLVSRQDARKERQLSPAFRVRIWRKGQSGNPSGQAAEYGEVMRLARAMSIRAVQRLGELVESDDERVAAVAANAILDRAFGRPKPRRDEDQDPLVERLRRMTPEERAQDAVDLWNRVHRQLAEHQREAAIETNCDVTSAKPALRDRRAPKRRSPDQDDEGGCCV